MSLVRSRLFAMLFLSLAATVISCGGVGTDSGRRLVSISVSPAAGADTRSNPVVQFVATGTYSAPPITVSSLPVLWRGSWTALSALCVGSPVPACEGINSNGVAMCGGYPTDVTITASAPADPNLPLGSKNVPMVTGTAALKC
ncbi:MAG: hypothetical protein WA634_07410 [Silvibacterium sp.]